MKVGREGGRRGWKEGGGEGGERLWSSCMKTLGIKRQGVRKYNCK